MDQANTSTPPEAKLHFLDYWRVIRIRKAIIITVFLITAIIATAVTFILPVSYASTTRIKVESDVLDIPGMGGTPSVSMSGFDPYFIQTTFEIMQSQIVLSNVIAALNLNVEWGKKYFGGETLKTSETMEILKGRMSLAPVRNTKLISITVYSDDAKDAAVVANTIAEAYRNYRVVTRQQLTSKGLDVLRDQYLNESNQIQTLQANVEQLRKDLGISDLANAAGPTPTLSQGQMTTYNQQQIEGERIYKELYVQVQELKAYDKTKLRDVLPTVIPDAALSSLLDQYHEAQRKIAVLKKDYSPDNLNVVRIQTLLDTLDGQINDRVTGIMAGLESQVSSKKAALDALTAAVDAAKVKDQLEAGKNQPYYDACEVRQGDGVLCEAGF